MGKTFSLICPETTFLIKEELSVCFLSFVLGFLLCMFIAFKYSLVRFFSFKKGSLMICDVFSCLEISLFIFWFSLKVNFGIIRLYMLAMLFLGALLFKHLFYISFQKLIFFMLSPLEYIGKLVAVIRQKSRKI